MFHKATLSYPLYELINKYSKQFVRTRFEAAGEGRYLPGNWCSGPVAICVAVLRSVLEYNVPWLDITPFLPICLYYNMRALRIIYLRKLYNLRESLELRTGSVGSVWALYCHLWLKIIYLYILFVYLIFNIHSILQSIHIFYLNCSLRTRSLSCVHYFQGPATQVKNSIEMASLGKHAALSRP